MPRMTPKQAEERIKNGAQKVTMKDVSTVLKKEKEIEELFSSNGPLGKFVADLKLLFAIIKDYYNGDYRQVPFWTIAAIVTALLYVLSPIDAIPDFIPVVGYLDDAAVVTVCLKMIKQDLQVYKEWKRG